GPATTTPINTASAQAVVITIQPLLCPLVPVSTTFATTPPPMRIRKKVPRTSALKGVIRQVFRSYRRDFVCLRFIYGTSYKEPVPSLLMIFGYAHFRKQV